MHDDDSGSEQQGSWQPPEYVSPWSGVRRHADNDAENASNDTIASALAIRQGTPSPRRPERPGRPLSRSTVSRATAQPRVRRSPGYGQPGYGQPATGSQATGRRGTGSQATAGPATRPTASPATASRVTASRRRAVTAPGAAVPWGGYDTPPPPPRSRFGRVLAYVAVAVLAAGAGAGAAVALNHTSNPSALPGGQRERPAGQPVRRRRQRTAIVRRPTTGQPGQRQRAAPTAAPAR